MYRIIGIFPDNEGKQHLKLISLIQLGVYAWNSVNKNIDWQDSSLFSSLNSTGFLTNANYDYLQNEIWLSKIENWTWSAVNAKNDSDSGPDYHNGLTPSEIYLHEMNRSTKSSEIGSWMTPIAKIGLMYVSDYTLSLGDTALSMTGGTLSNTATLKTGWLHPINNDISKNGRDWTISRCGNYYPCFVTQNGYISSNNVYLEYGVKPVFYLTSNVTYSLGTGKYDDPYIINE